MTLRQQLALTASLSMPAMMGRISAVVMEYIDAAMVGRLGANQSASVGLVATTQWLFWGITAAAATGFSVQVAHYIGAGEKRKARSVVLQSILATSVLGILLLIIGCAISPWLPAWLGGGKEINADATVYFFIFALSIPFMQLNFLAGSMLRCSGDMRVPSNLNILMCFLDVVFNLLLIFPSSYYHIAGLTVFLPGAGMGVLGAALGTAFSEVIVAALMLYFLLYRSHDLRMVRGEQCLRLARGTLRKALRLGTPMGLERIVMCGAQIISTMIVAPLGVMAIAANSFAVTAESLCYMPGYGIADAATTLVGQCVGARRGDLCRRFAHITVGLGIAVMTVMGIIMYLCAPVMMSLLSPVEMIQQLGSSALRIEAFAEPMFAASIVAYGVFVGAGDTLAPSIMNFSSMWAVRLTAAALLAPVMGLNGVWLAMSMELCFRGILFLVRLRGNGWLRRAGLA